jgi:hypothetical protein
VLPFGRNGDYVGRESLLLDLKKTFCDDDNEENCQHATLDDLGGIGKTKIALEFAFQLQKNRQNILSSG